MKLDTAKHLRDFLIDILNKIITAPLCKGGCHFAKMTGGLFGCDLQSLRQNIVLPPHFAQGRRFVVLIYEKSLLCL